MKVIFIVQGEGRGHMTQALALEQILNKTGHEVSGVIIGTSNRREVPDYFKNKTKAKLYKIASPNFYYDKSNKAINIWKTCLYNLSGIYKYVRELKKINIIIKKNQPDVIINFYDLLGGIYFKLYSPKVKRLCIGHQYLASHPEFMYPKGKHLQKKLFHITNYITGLNTHQRLALSFKDYTNSPKSLNVIPPLLREEIFHITPESGDYILAYVVNQGYADDIMLWHSHNKKIKIHCFWDNKEHEDEWSPWKNLTFHHINDTKFLTYMSNCMGYVSTAGFESICEAMYLGKPVMMVPVEKQYEQSCNALDAEKSGAGIAANSFKLEPFLHYISKHKQEPDKFKEWTHLSQSIVLKEIESYIPEEAESTIAFSFSRLTFDN